MESLPRGNIAVWNGNHTLRFASASAWEYLGWQVLQNGRLELYPAEMYGRLPVADGR
jgi:hypothetical protein